MASLGDMFVRVGADISGFSAAMREMKSSLGSVANELKGAGTAMTAFFTVPIAGVAFAAVKAAGEMEALKMAMNTITKSSSQTAIQLERLKEVAKLPGLGFKEAVQGSINLQSAGFSAQLAERSLKAFGNALATVGKGRADLEGINLVLSQILPKPEILGQDLNQLRERLPQVAMAMKATFGAETLEDLKRLHITGRQFVEGLTAYFEKQPMITSGFNNSMENMKDQIFLTSVALGESLLPIAQRFLDWASGAVGQLKDLAEGFKGLSKPAQNATLAVSTFLALLGPGTFIAGSFISSLGQINKVLAAIGISGAGAAAAGGILLGVAMAGGIIAGLAQQYPAIAAALNAAFGGGYGSPGGKSHYTFGNQNPFFLGTARNSGGSGSGEFPGAERPGMMTGSAGDFGGEFGGLIKSVVSGPDASKIKAAFADLGVKNLALDLAEAEAAFRLLTAAGKLNAGQSQEAQDHIAKLRFELERLTAGLSATTEKLHVVPFAEKSRDGAVLTATFEAMNASIGKTTKEIGEFIKETGGTTEEFFTKKMTEAAASVERFNTIPPPAANWEAPIKDAGKALKEALGIFDQLPDPMRAVNEAASDLGVSLNKGNIPKLTADYERLAEAQSQNAISMRSLNQAYINLIKAKAADGQATDEEIAKAKQLEEAATVGMRKVAKDRYDLGRELEQMSHRTFDSLERDLAKNIIAWKGWKDTLKNIGKGFAEDFLQIMLKGLFKPLEDQFAKLAGQIGGALGGVFSKTTGGGIGGAPIGVGGIPGSVWDSLGLGSGGAQTIGGLPGGAPGPVNNAGGAASQALGSSLSSVMGMVTGAVSAISGVIGNFQFAGMNKSLDVIVNHTLRTFNEVFQQRIDHWSQFNQTFTRLGEIWNTLKAGGGGGVTIDMRNSNFGGVTQQSIEAMFQAAFLKAQAARG